MTDVKKGIAHIEYCINKMNQNIREIKHYEYVAEDIREIWVMIELLQVMGAADEREVDRLHKLTAQEA